MFLRADTLLSRASQSQLLGAFAGLAAAEIAVSIAAVLVGRLQRALLAQARPVPRWSGATLLGSELAALFVALPILTAASGLFSDWLDPADIALVIVSLLGPGLALGVLQARALIAAGAGPRARYWILAQGAGLPLAAGGIAAGFWLASREHAAALPATIAWLGLVWWQMGRILSNLVAPPETR